MNSYFSPISRCMESAYNYMYPQTHYWMGIVPVAKESLIVCNTLTFVAAAAIAVTAMDFCTARIRQWNPPAKRTIDVEAESDDVDIETISDDQDVNIENISEAAEENQSPETQDGGAGVYSDYCDME